MLLNLISSMVLTRDEVDDIIIFVFDFQEKKKDMQ